MSAYQNGTTFFYEQVNLYKTFTITKGTDSIINQSVNLPRRSISGLLLLFVIAIHRRNTRLREIREPRHNQYSSYDRWDAKQSLQLGTETIRPLEGGEKTLCTWGRDKFGSCIVLWRQQVWLVDRSEDNRRPGNTRGRPVAREHSRWRGARD